MRCICRIVQVECELFPFFRGESARRPAEMATADLLKDSKPPLTLRPNFNREKGSVTAGGGSPLTLRPNFNCKKGSVTAGGGSPLTLRPNFKCEKGSVTAAAAACSPRRGIFVDKNSQDKKASPEKKGAMSQTCKRRKNKSHPPALENA